MIYEKGDIVRVSIPSDADVPHAMRDFNDKEFKIIATSKNKSRTTGYCMLEGAVSERGTQYAFMNSWLIKA